MSWRESTSVPSKSHKTVVNTGSLSFHGCLRTILYAGEIMAGNVLGEGYLAGIGMTIGGVFGRIAGEEAARHASNAA